MGVKKFSVLFTAGVVSYFASELIRGNPLLSLWVSVVAFLICVVICYRIFPDL